MSSTIERADRISRGRALAAPFVGVAMLSVQQWLFFVSDWSEVSGTQLAIWAALALLASLALVGGDRWLMPRSVRPFVHDESSRANRLQAIFGGFVAAMLTTLIVFIVSPFEPLSGQRAAHIIISLGLGVSLLSFGIAELRGLD